MKTSKRPTSSAWRNGILVLALIASSPAMAASYNIILKTNAGAIQSCATGGFSFTKTVVGTFPATGASVTLNGTQATTCFGADSARTLSTGTLNVNVANVELNGQDQGPNVVSIQGNLSSGSGSNNYTIRFASNKTFTVTQNTGQDPQVGAGTYYVFNENAVPEPQTLGLVAAALGALLLARRLRRRA